jgi:hypothetical protein
VADLAGEQYITSHLTEEQNDRGGPEIVPPGLPVSLEAEEKTQKKKRKRCVFIVGNEFFNHFKINRIGGSEEGLEEEGEQEGRMNDIDERRPLARGTQTRSKKANDDQHSQPKAFHWEIYDESEN